MVIRRHIRYGAAEEALNFRIFFGRIIHSKSLKKFDILSRGSLGVKPDGTIAFLRENGCRETAMAAAREMGYTSVEVIEIAASQFLFPGMIDTHLHAPQWPNLALGMEGNLREWREEWTDPIEVITVSMTRTDC